MLINEYISLLTHSSVDYMSYPVIYFSTIINGLRQRHSTLCDFLLSSDPEICMCVLRLMHMAGFPPNLSTAQLTRICGVIALTFFTSIHKRVLDTGKLLHWKRDDHIILNVWETSERWHSFVCMCLFLY